MAAKGRLGAAYPYRNATIIVMAQANKTAEQRPSFAELAADARALTRRALKASLATMDAATNYPYASLITLGTDPSGAPVFFISGLARHTKNLLKDARASVLVDGTGALGDPLQGARVTPVRPRREDGGGGGAAALSRPAPSGGVLCGLPRFQFLAPHGRGRPLYRRLRPHRRSRARGPPHRNERAPRR